MITTLETTQDVYNICTNSTYLQRQGFLDCYYVYIHYQDNIPFYVGQGSHNRAYKLKGRSGKWYERQSQSLIVIKIIKDRLTFQQSLELEKQLIIQLKATLINEDFGHSPNESFPVLCFKKNGELVKRYNNSKETEIDGYSSGAVSVNCNPNQKRYTYKGLVWCYEKDYENRKDTLFTLATNCSRAIEVTFPDGTVKKYGTLTETKKDGLLPAKVGAVLSGKRNSHKGCSFRYLDL